MSAAIIQDFSVTIIFFHHDLHSIFEFRNTMVWMPVYCSQDVGPSIDFHFQPKILNVDCVSAFYIKFISNVDFSSQ